MIFQATELHSHLPELHALHAAGAVEESLNTQASEQADKCKPARRSCNFSPKTVAPLLIHCRTCGTSSGKASTTTGFNF